MPLGDLHLLPPLLFGQIAILMSRKAMITKRGLAPKRPSAARRLRITGSGTPPQIQWPTHPGDALVSVVIPVLNESARIASVIRLALKSPLVGEVLVLDDGSIDGTPELAEAAGARVITSTLLGKGSSMEDGVLYAQHETLLFLDGDLAGLSDDLVQRMTEPVLRGEADFVKASFSRRAGRVTVLTARPLLRTYFPEIAHFEQPLGGIIAARKALLLRVHFENDYGVDIGLLIDVTGAGARLLEVDIGHLEHDSQDLERLGEMAAQVARAILERAAALGRLRLSFVRQSDERDRMRRAQPEQILSRIGHVERLALFDMDGTLLAGRFVVELARRTEKTAHLEKYLDRLDLKPETRTRRIAAIFRGVQRELMEQTARSLPLTPGAVEAVVGLRKLGYRVGIITDSYHVAAETVRRRVFADFALSNVMEFRHGKATGVMTMAPTFRSGHTGWRAYDKLNALRFLVKRLEITAKQVLAVGDSDNDIGMLRAAGKSFAYQPKSERVRRAAKRVIHGRLDELLKWVH
jgi:glucosyl-3-phosphoglycerate synthase